VWNLFFRKLAAIEIDSSLLTFTKSAKADPFTTVHERYFLFGSKPSVTTYFLLLETIVVASLTWLGKLAVETTVGFLFRGS